MDVDLAGDHALDANGDFLHSLQGGLAPLGKASMAAVSNTPLPHGPLMTVLETVGEVCTDG